MTPRAFDADGWSRAADVNTLLSALLRTPRPAADLPRLYLDPADLARELHGRDPSAAATGEGELLGALVEFLASGGRSPAVGEAMARGEEALERVRWTLEWDALAPHVQERAVERAAAALQWARREGWVAESEEARLTPAGELLARDGGLPMR